MCDRWGRGRRDGVGRDDDRLRMQLTACSLPAHCMCTAFALPFLDRSPPLHCLCTAFALPFHCLSTAFPPPFHCLSTDIALPFPRLSTAFHCPPQPFTVSPPFNCLSLTFHYLSSPCQCLFTASRCRGRSSRRPCCRPSPMSQSGCGWPRSRRCRPGPPSFGIIGTGMARLQTLVRQVPFPCPPTAFP